MDSLEFVTQATWKARGTMSGAQSRWSPRRYPPWHV
jgi:hypothetical protein